MILLRLYLLEVPNKESAHALSTKLFKDNSVKQTLSAPLYS